MSGEQVYSALVEARVERVPGVDGLLLKEKVGGKGVLSHSLDRFDEDERCTEIIVLVTPTLREWIATDPLTFASPKLRMLDASDGLHAAVTQAAGTVVVLHDGLRPNWQLALLDSLLRQWRPGISVLPAEHLHGQLAQWSIDGTAAAGDTSAAADIFGSGKPAASTPLRHLTSFVGNSQLCLLETPQVYDKDALATALAAHPTAVGAPEACHSAGVPLLLLPARAHNFVMRDGDALHLLRRLLGEAKKGGKDKYGGLGW